MIQTTVKARSLSDFTCKLWMMRGGNLLILGHGVIGQGHLWHSVYKTLLVNRFNHTSWVTAVAPTDRPKSVRNSCVIKVFGGVFMLSRCFLDCSVGVGVFVTGLSQISSFFSCGHYTDYRFSPITFGLHM